MNSLNQKVFGARCALILSACAAVLSACASNAFVASWQAPDATPLEVEGSKVAAVVMMSDEASRRAAEDTLARELTARGATGVPLYTIVAGARPEDEAAVRAALENNGVAGVVVMRPVDTQTEIVSTPVTFTSPTYGRLWGGYYGFGWGVPWGVGVGIGFTTGNEVRTSTIVSVETLVYSLRQNKLVWGGESRTANPSNVDWLVRDTAHKVARELDRRGLIAGWRGCTARRPLSRGRRRSRADRGRRAAGVSRYDGRRGVRCDDEVTYDRRPSTDAGAFFDAPDELGRRGTMSNASICSHLSAIETIKHEREHQCDECVKTGDSWVHLRTCQTCGGTHCCDSSVNRHATRHAQMTGHPVVASAEPGERWLYCYPDRQTVGY